MLEENDKLVIPKLKVMDLFVDFRNCMHIEMIEIPDASRGSLILHDIIRQYSIISRCDT